MTESSGASRPFVAVAGNIATGKTGLVERLAAALEATPLHEEVDRNPYFSRFYADPARWAFHSQMAFATDSLLRHSQALRRGAVVQDRTVYESIDVFGTMLFESGHLDREEMDTLRQLGRCARRLPRQPTAMLYLDAGPPTLLERVADRERSPERQLTAEYLQGLREHYERFVAEWEICPVIAIDTEARDLRDPAELDRLLGELPL